MPDERFETYDDLFDRLAADARIQPVEDSLMEVTSTEALNAAREFVNRAITDGIVSAHDLARRTGLKETAISVFRNNKWKGKAGTQSTLAGTLCKAINQIIRRQQADATSVDGFVQSRVAEAIYALAQYAIKREAIVGFDISAGHGKTITLTTIVDETPGAVLLTVNRTRSSPKSFLQLWSRALGLDVQGRAEDLQDRVTNRLVRSGRLIAIDECHKLQVPTLDVIREVHDAARCPMILSGTPSFKAMLTSQRVGTLSRELLDQLYSRVSMYRSLDDLTSNNQDSPGVLVTMDDIRKVFARGRVRISRDGMKFLMHLANTPASGGLRVCRGLVHICIDLYPEEIMTASLLRQALAMRVGTREAGFLINLAEPVEASDDSQQVAAG